MGRQLRRAGAAGPALRGRPPTIATLLAFGRLIGNTDMHSGNPRSSWCSTICRAGAFTLAPAYDMLSMRWRPNASLGATPTTGLRTRPGQPVERGRADRTRLLGSAGRAWREPAAPLRNTAAEMHERLAAPKLP
ncbi:hypothetical protein FSC37_22805 [Piscinibacter aquaticus]|uniref:Uncharacterized protein n=1 Tax=Piscinibacter aquaticus TaxID=392597 RepID=A0A5C6TNI1_9BURK|nr:hypothetical protein FSC37_22805 [Piscinibacter aquaticus]